MCRGYLRLQILTHRKVHRNYPSSYFQNQQKWRNSFFLCSFWLLPKAEHMHFSYFVAAHRRTLVLSSSPRLVCAKICAPFKYNAPKSAPELPKFSFLKSANAENVLFSEHQNHNIYKKPHFELKKLQSEASFFTLKPNRSVCVVFVQTLRRSRICRVRPAC